jgi:hypothetical protein
MRTDGYEVNSRFCNFTKAPKRRNVNLELGQQLYMLHRSKISHNSHLSILHSWKLFPNQFSIFPAYNPSPTLYLQRHTKWL